MPRHRATAVALFAFVTTTGCVALSGGAGDATEPLDGSAWDADGWALVSPWIARDFANRIVESRDYAIGGDDLVVEDTSEFLWHLRDALEADGIALRTNGADGVPTRHRTVRNDDTVVHAIRVGAIEYRRRYQVEENVLQRPGPMTVTYKADPDGVWFDSGVPAKRSPSAPARATETGNGR